MHLKDCVYMCAFPCHMTGVTHHIQRHIQMITDNENGQNVVYQLQTQQNHSCIPFLGPYLKPHGCQTGTHQLPYPCLGQAGVLVPVNHDDVSMVTSA